MLTSYSGVSGPKSDSHPTCSYNWPSLWSSSGIFDLSLFLANNVVDFLGDIYQPPSLSRRRAILQMRGQL